jgi:hypothetical protein
MVIIDRLIQSPTEDISAEGKAGRASTELCLAAWCTWFVDIWGREGSQHGVYLKLGDLVCTLLSSRGADASPNERRGYVHRL